MVTVISIILLILACLKIDLIYSCKETVHELNDDNWREVLEGRWFIKFYATWCPACKAMRQTWDDAAKVLAQLDVCVAKCDMTENSELSGRFFVTALPTIYFIDNGTFYLYSEGRSTNDFLNFVVNNKYMSTESLPWYRSPTSYHMAALGFFFSFSMLVRQVHQQLTEKGFPMWAVYLTFAFATIIIGLVIGLMIVCLCDLIRPATPQELLQQFVPKEDIQRNEVPKSHKSVQAKKKIN